MRPPLVTVLMPVHNGEPFLREAAESVLAQTLRDIEFLVVDDGSTDGTGRILQGFGDPRLRVLRNETNRGLVAALNRGLDAAMGHYVARLDSDDVAHPDRLERQVAALEARPSLVIVGSAYREIDREGRILAVHSPPESDTEIRWQLLFHCPFAHSAVMVRAESLQAAGLRYSEEAVCAEDYDLWSRLLDRGEGMNLPEPLVSYRSHPQQVSRRNAPQKVRTADAVSRRNFAALGVDLTDGQVAVLRKWFNEPPSGLGEEQVRLYGRLMDAIGLLAGRPRSDPAVIRRIRRRWALRGLKAAVPGALFRPGGAGLAVDLLGVLAGFRG